MLMFLANGGLIVHIIAQFYFWNKKQEITRKEKS